MSTCTGDQAQGQQQTLSSRRLGHFPRMADQTSFSLQKQDSLLSTPPRARVQQGLTWPSSLVTLVEEVQEVTISEEDRQG